MGTVVTTTLTPYDSSASSGSGTSSDSLNSLSSGSVNEGSSASDSSGSGDSSGSTASGSSGVYLQIWQWVLLAALLCCCLGAIGAGATMGKKKPMAYAAPMTYSGGTVV